MMRNTTINNYSHLRIEIKSQDFCETENNNTHAILYLHHTIYFEIKLIIVRPAGAFALKQNRLPILMKDICETLSQHNFISYSKILSNNNNNDNHYFENDGRNLASSSSSDNDDNLPNPSIFFTWYCEKAREIEKNTGSVELSLSLLDYALNNVSNSRLAKRFIMATRASLVKYNKYIVDLTAKLELESVSDSEKLSILNTLRSIDLKEYEKSCKKVKAPPNVPTILPSPDTASTSTSADSIEDKSTDWSFELNVLDLILQSKFNEAFDTVQSSIFFPTILLDACNDETTRIRWLSEYCSVLVLEFREYINKSQSDFSHLSLISSDLFEDDDPWSKIVLDTVYNINSTNTEQMVYLINSKAKSALSLLKSIKPSSHNDKKMNRSSSESEIFF